MSDGRLQGCNTDGEGLVYDVQRLDAPPKGRRILIIGAGGATRGVLIPLLEAGADSLKIINRTPARAKKIADELCQQQPQYENKLTVGSLQDTGGRSEERRVGKGWRERWGGGGGREQSGGR